MKKLLARITILLVSLLIAVLIIERFLARIPVPFNKITDIGTYSQFNVEYGVEPKPNLEYSEYEHTVRTNADATFGPPIARDGTPIILHLGDSYTAGPGVAYEKNYPHLLQETINASSSTKYQAVILGMGGSSPMQQSLIYQHKLTDLKPSLVIYELYDNDNSDDYAFSLSDYLARISTYSKIPSWLRETAIGKRLFLFQADALTKKWAAQYAAEKDQMYPQQEKIWNTLTAPALSTIKARAASQGAPFVLFYVPSGWELENEYATGSAQPRNAQNTLSEKWAQEQNVPYFNMTADFVATNTAKLNEIYLDGTKGYHLNEMGTEMVAKKLYQLVEEKKLLTK